MIFLLKSCRHDFDHGFFSVGGFFWDRLNVHTFINHHPDRQKGERLVAEGWVDGWMGGWVGGG
jgi:hypothetical protein